MLPLPAQSPQSLIFNEPKQSTLNPHVPPFLPAPIPPQNPTYARPFLGSVPMPVVQPVPTTQNDQVALMEKLVVQQQQGILESTLPGTTMPIFSGSPLDYCSFMRAFKTLIMSKTKSSSARLHYLVQYTSGEVQELLKCFLLNQDDDAGFEEALSLLRSKYGHGYKIAVAAVESVRKRCLNQI